MNYTLNQLRVFLKIVQTESVTKASEELFLSQPAVSIQLKNFQDQFPIPLTEVVGRKIQITDFGREIAESAEQILQQVQAIDFKTAAYKGLLAGRLRISIVSTAKYVMPYFLTDFMNLHPEVKLQMDVTNKQKVIESLENNEIDFALVSLLPSKMKVEKLDLLDNNLYLVGKTGIDFKPDQKVEEIFKNLPLIFREEGSGTRQTMEKFIEDQNLTVIKRMELATNEAVKQSILAGLGFSIMPLIGLRNELETGKLQIIPCPGLPITTEWQLIWREGKKHSPVSEEFLAYLKIHKEEIIADKFAWCN
ncbi:LysR family transcriptional regulator [Halpernia frigidisoli]|uniref:DNA-binding transcriptional regulator, LysR family n=1 Tax=Halpernia frigidisoli TaxID=1125876 RepID=A0A1I3CZG7_9FLAO|nr:LysR family transcriptional regulator [Halpernia frigidisoli]SFH79930.1 DNA-binding transcriptional regulator, LysR family [Halpernia frigidisoli]